MTAVRQPWDELPDEVRGAIESVLGASVADAANQPGGFSPSLAARCRLADGRRAFVKAAAPSPNPQTVAMLRDEIAVAGQLPPSLPAPRLRRALTVGDWVVAIFDEIDGRQPRMPWEAGELAAVLDAVEMLAVAADPSPAGALPTIAERHRATFSWWRRAATGAAVPEPDGWAAQRVGRLAELEAAWERGAAGSALLHCDIRADNVLLGVDGTVWFVDWPHASIGASWVDLLLMLPSVAHAGGPDPEEAWARSTVAANADADAVTAVVAALDGYFTFQARQPDPPGLPHVRRYQAELGDVTRRWLRRRTDLG